MKKKKKGGKKLIGKTGKVRTSNATVTTDGNYWWVEQYEHKDRRLKR